ncbi:MAG: 23S rRNA (pseudouridine(1915)-N(3))-methyltransferase RlmH [Lachnospiraceae bacterium]|nr:23S rRNA (pseudouridine(1915)-N(3))-methyltransferase RlmH [Lachnospiraceae bacterium]
MRISILCVGKIKESYFRDGIAEYMKRLSRYATTEIIEVQDEKTPDGASAAEEQQILMTEGERLNRHLSDDAYKIALCIDGKKMDSVTFSAKIEQIKTSGYSHIQFLIGGSLGLSEAVVRRADMRLSFSDMTFPHQLMRVVLLEQIYRAFRIANHEPYHK